MTHTSNTEIIDTYANRWKLDSEGAVQVRPAGDIQWQTVSPNPSTGWQYLLADRVGFIWISGPEGLRRLEPHRNQAGWLKPDSDALPSAPITALAISPAGLILVGYANGDIVDVDMDSEGHTFVRKLHTGSAPVTALEVDIDGRIVVTTESGSEKLSATPDAWQKSWEERARLPGGNHDLFAIETDGKMWMAGGLTHGLGYPPLNHVFDEVIAYDPVEDTWHIAGHMPFPRCYSGIAELAGDIWIIGGAANLTEPENPKGPRMPLDDVRIFTCSEPGDKSDSITKNWRSGPSLNRARLEPVVQKVNERIWVIGGTDGEPMTHVESIGVGEAAWRNEAPLPWTLNQAGGCVLDGLIYCISRNGLLRLDPRSGEWDTGLPQLAESPQAAQVAAFDGKMWVMGGSRRRDTNTYDPKTRSWSKGPDLPTDNSWGAALELGGRLIVAGGAHWSERHQRYFFDDRVFALRT